MFPVAQGTKIRSKEIGNVPCVDVDAVDNDRNGNYAVSHTPLDAGVDCATKGMSELDDFAQNNSTSPEHNPRFIPNKFQPGSLGTRDSNPELASPEKVQINLALLRSPCSVLDLFVLVHHVQNPDL